jgi:uncharacterized protein (DUF608 family)
MTNAMSDKIDLLWMSHPGSFTLYEDDFHTSRTDKLLTLQIYTRFRMVNSVPSFTENVLSIDNLRTVHEKLIVRVTTPLDLMCVFRVLAFNSSALRAITFQSLSSK